MLVSKPQTTDQRHTLADFEIGFGQGLSVTIGDNIVVSHFAI